MASVIAELICAKSESVALVTPEDMAAAWSNHTSEQTRTQRRLLHLGIEIVTAHRLKAYDGSVALLACTFTGRERRLKADSLVLVTARRPNDELFHELSERLESEGAPKTLKRIGNCEAPAIIAAAVYTGHRYARELDCPESNRAPILHDRVF